MSKRITLLGSTGSIGRQSLEVIAACGMEVAALAANSSVELMERQARQFRPELAVLADEKAAADLKVRLADTGTKVLSGMGGLLEAAAVPSADTAIAALVGMVGLRPTLAAIREGKRIALANKETLVCAGPLVLEEARDYGAEILPVDSEHSALFQSLELSLIHISGAGCNSGQCPWEGLRRVPDFGGVPVAGLPVPGRCVRGNELQRLHPDIRQCAGLRDGSADHCGLCCRTFDGFKEVSMEEGTALFLAERSLL